MFCIAGFLVVGLEACFASRKRHLLLSSRVGAVAVAVVMTECAQGAVFVAVRGGLLAGVNHGTVVTWRTMWEVRWSPESPPRLLHETGRLLAAPVAGTAVSDGRFGAVVVEVGTGDLR